MSQYALEPIERRMSREPYREWSIDAPTSRRVDVALMTPRHAEESEAKHGITGRLNLIEDIYGDNCIRIVTSSGHELRAIMRSPGQKRRSEQWHANQPRYGSWGHYLADVALVRYIFEFAGWTPTPEEARLMDALDEYGRKAPVRLRAAA